MPKERNCKVDSYSIALRVLIQAIGVGEHHGFPCNALWRNVMKSKNVNNQPDNRAKEKAGSRAGTADKGNLNQSQQSGQTGSQQQANPGQRQSNDLAGGLPRSPGTKNLSADEDMDDDTGLSNRANRQSADDIDEGSRQSRQSNVGRRDDGTPD